MYKCTLFKQNKKMTQIIDNIVKGEQFSIPFLIPRVILSEFELKKLDKR